MSKKPKRKNKRDRQVSTMRSGHGLGAISDVPTFRNKINADLGTTLSKVLTEDLDIQEALDGVAERTKAVMTEAGYYTWD